jgi:protein involved in polysaccharide export with SLBB domain
MRKTVNISLSPVRLLVALSVVFLPICSMAAEKSAEDLLGRSEGTNSSPFASPTSMPQFAPATQLPDQPKLHNPPERSRLSSEETTLLIDREQKEQTARKKSEPSAIEKLISDDEIIEASEVSDENPTRTLIQFGYSYFQNLFLLPQIDIQVSPDYLAGPGDSIVLTVWGSIEGSYEMVVSSGGEVVLPRVGPVRVAGLPFGKLADVFRVHLAKVFRDFDLAVNMGKLRTNKISVIGEVTAPGDYTVSSLATVLNALSAAGGPTRNGSLRNITIRRSGKAEETIDLYDFFLTGDKRKDVRLSSGDTIFVPVIGRITAVAGMVKRPAIYELKNETTLKELITLAEGVTATGYLQRVQISRVIANQNKQIIDLNLDPGLTGKSFDELAAGIPVQDMDIVKVFPINRLLRNHFKLEGHLERPGSYALKPGIRISSVLNHQLLLPEYAPTIEVTRLYPPNMEPRKILLDLEKALAGIPDQDIEIKEFDTIKLFSKWELQENLHVRVSGEVQAPGEFPLFKGMTVRDLLLQAGNPNASAYLKDAEISRMSIHEEKAQLQPIIINLEEALRGNPEHNVTLEPFDELTVRRIPNWIEAMDRYVTLSGEFVFPGVYPIYRGERLSSVISRAGGFTDKAYPKGAKFTRETVRKLQQQRMDEALERAQAVVLNKKSTSLSSAASKEELEATRASLDALERSIAILRTKKAEGRMIISLVSAEKLVGSHSNFELAGGDQLQVPPDPDSVNILGNVYNPTTALFVPWRNVQYYLDKVGGPTSEGDTDEMYLVKADGTVYSKHQAEWFLFYNGFLSSSVDSGDTIIVPQKIEKTAWLRDIKDITTIISQIAISAGTVFLGLR